jgi:putative hydrolase of the HAD superfamily/hydrolase
LSNAGADWINELLDKNDVRLFDDIVLSYQHGVTKPSREIYLLAAKRLGLEPKECVFIDDAQRHCLAAKEAGMKAINYNDFEQMKTELEELLSAGSDD